MSAPSWGRGPEPPAGEGELRGPGRVQTARVGGGAAVLGVTGKRRAFPGRVGGGRPPKRIGLRAIARSSGASPASRRAVCGSWSGRGPWDLVARVRPPISEVAVVLQIKISIVRLHQLSVRKITDVARFSVVTRYFGVISLGAPSRSRILILQAK